MKSQAEYTRDIYEKVYPYDIVAKASPSKQWLPLKNELVELIINNNIEYEILNKLVTI